MADAITILGVVTSTFPTSTPYSYNTPTPAPYQSSGSGGGDLITIILVAVLAAAVTFLLMSNFRRKKTWYLETLNPRQHYEVGAEKGLISNMEIHGHHFYGIEAGPYKVFLAYGSMEQFSKPVLTGKLEEMYVNILAKTLLGKHYVTKEEKHRFLDFLYSHVPSLAIHAHMITGELISPQTILDTYWKGNERDEALIQMRRRHLIDARVLWVKPYPPEEKLASIQSGTLLLPDVMMDFTEITAANRETLMRMNAGMATLVKEVIILEREIITSISDPIQVIGMILTDRARKVEGLGLEQLSDKGSVQGVLYAAERIKAYKDKFTEILGQDITPEEIKEILARLDKLEALKKKLDKGAPQPAAAQQPPPQQK
jgi:hypothetical protein